MPHNPSQNKRTYLTFYDTETTGFPLYKLPSDDPEQPHIVELAAAVVDVELRTIVSSMTVFIKPQGYEIPDETTDVHGITTELALNAGVYLGRALPIFLDLVGDNTRVAFNESFDARMIRIAQHQMGLGEAQLEDWKQGKKACAMQMARKHTALVKNKAPTLTEAYRHFFGVDFEGAHTAMGDVHACIAVYFAVIDKEKAR